VALHLIGLGLHDIQDITVKGLERVRRCDRVYAEFYTAILGGSDHASMEAFLETKVALLDREGVECGGKELVTQAATQEVALLTAGDPLAATTHTDLMVRARAAGVEVHIVHAPSIYSAAPGLLGLQHYKFGRTTTLVRPEENWLPESMFDAVQENHDAGLHTLVLLDIKADEARPAGRGDGWPDQGYYMTADEGLQLLQKLAVMRGADWFQTSQVGVVARAGSERPLCATGPVGAMAAREFGAPLHCLVIPGKLQIVESEAWESLSV
jgi:diphthine synthase